MNPYTLNPFSMTQLTKEHLDQQLKKLATKDDLKPLATKKALEEQTEQLATIINTAFQEQKDHMDQKFVHVDEQFEKVNDRLQVVETKLDRALYEELAHLEARVTRLEKRIEPVQAKGQNV